MWKHFTQLMKCECFIELSLSVNRCSKEQQHLNLVFRDLQTWAYEALLLHVGALLCDQPMLQASSQIWLSFNRMDIITFLCKSRMNLQSFRKVPFLLFMTLETSSEQVVCVVTMVSSSSAFYTFFPCGVILLTLSVMQMAWVQQWVHLLYT